jgi:hypothetical protein
MSDARFAVRHGHWQALLHSPALRVAQMIGRRRGFVDGLRERGQ